ATTSPATNDPGPASAIASATLRPSIVSPARATLIRRAGVNVSGCAAAEVGCCLLCAAQALSSEASSGPPVAILLVHFGGNQLVLPRRRPRRLSGRTRHGRARPHPLADMAGFRASNCPVAE